MTDPLCGVSCDTTLYPTDLGYESTEPIPLANVTKRALSKVYWATGVLSVCVWSL